MRAERSWALAAWVFAAIGLATTLVAQLHGSRRGAPSPFARMLLSCTPFAVVALGLWQLARTTGYAVTFLVAALLVWFWAGAITNDELGLTYWFVPVFQLGVAVIAVAAVWLHAWWRRRGDATPGTGGL